MTATGEGSLYELVARGNKDLYFFADNDKSRFIFNNAYNSQAERMTEIRTSPPRSTAEFGRAVEFDIDLVGDIITDPTIIIKLPSWLPPPQVKTIGSSIITDSANISYGYVNGIAYFLFENISLYQDNILLQEFSGDTLWAFSQIEGTYANRNIINELTGQHDGSALNIGRNAAPPSLRVRLPLLGCQSKDDVGFPIRAAQGHTFKLKCKLRKLEDLVESSDQAATGKPTPWGHSGFIQKTSATKSISFNTLHRTSMSPLELSLETTQVYVSAEIQKELMKSSMLLATKYFENKFTQSLADYAGVSAGSASQISRYIDGRHPTKKILFYFRTSANTNANRLWNITLNKGSFYNTISLLVAGQQRELPRQPFVWRDIVNFRKEEIDSEMEINTMNWTLGDTTIKVSPQQVTGTINLTTAYRPSFYMDLLTSTSFTELYVITEGHFGFQTEQGRAELFSLN